MSTHREASGTTSLFHPAWTLRTDAAEADRLGRLCLHPASAYAADPAPIGTVAWWAAVDRGALPVRVREGRITAGSGRPGHADPVITVRAADGTDTVHAAHAAPWAPWGLVGRQARITLVGHPAKPGREEPVCWVQILCELSAKPKRRGARPRGKAAKRRQPVQADGRELRTAQAERDDFYHLDDPLLARGTAQPAARGWVTFLPASRLGFGLCAAFLPTFLLAAVGWERFGAPLSWPAAFALFVPAAAAALYGIGWIIGQVRSRTHAPPR